MLTLPTNDFPRSLRLTRKRKQFLSVLSPGQTVSTFGSWWDGGSKSSFHFRRLTDGAVRSASYSSLAPQFGGEVTSLRPEPGYALVKTGYFRGKPSTPHVHILAEDLPALLGVTDCRISDPAIAADWLEETDRPELAARLRALLAPSY